MPLWTGLVIGWIVICTDATPPNGRWGNPPLTLYATQAACIEADRAMNVSMEKLWRAAGRTDPLGLTCWCQHVTPAKVGP
jgi:hypothetical protein